MRIEIVLVMLKKIVKIIQQLSRCDLLKITVPTLIVGKMF